MPAPSTQRLRIAIDDEQSVSALLCVPDGAWAAYVFAHGAGAGMEHPFMAAVAERMAGQGVATLRYQFPSMERGSRRPDTPKVAHAAVRAAVAEAAVQLPGTPLFAGGKSFGGRMTSQAQALAPLEAVRGLVFVGFPLHPAGKPAEERAQHLFDVELPMLFIQGDARAAGTARTAAGYTRVAGAAGRRGSRVSRARAQRSQRRADAGRARERRGAMDADPVAPTVRASRGCEAWGEHGLGSTSIGSRT
jgi:uncharacterized protein